MTCEEFTALLGDLLEGDLSDGKAARCAEHRTACRDCAAYTASYAATIRLARDAFREDEPAAAGKSVEALIARILNRTVLRNQASVSEFPGGL